MQPPSLASWLPQPVQQYLIRLASALTTVEGVTQKLASVPPPVPVDPTSVRNALQANGKAPLNVTNLIGKLAQPQLAGVPQVTALPGPNTPTAQDGALVRFNGLLYYFDQSVDPGVWKPVTGVGAVLTGTHTQRISATYTPPSLYPTGTVFYETDRRLLYIVTAGVWVYLMGTFSITQAGIAALTATLGTVDFGLLLNVTDYAHELQWSGTVWGWGPGESGGGYFQDFAVAPTGSGWHVANGAAGVTYLKADGTTGTVTLPNTSGTPAYRKNGAAYAAGITAAVAPIASGNTDAASTGDGVSTSPVTVQSGAGATVVGSVSFVPGSHFHSITGADVLVALPGDPIANYSAITYFRQ